MLDKALFEVADIDCADNYASAREVRAWDDMLNYLENNNLRIDTLVFKPKSLQVRFGFVPRPSDDGITYMYTVNNPAITFLRRLWDVGVSEVQAAIKTYMVRGYKNEYDGLTDDDKTWLLSAVLGGKDD